MAENPEDIEQKVKITYDTNAKKAAKETKSLDKEINKTTQSTKKSSKATKEKGQSLEDLGGGIGSTITAMKGLIKVMWAMVANPIGAVIAAVVLAVTALYKAFTSTKAGGEQLEQVMDGIGAVMDVLRDRVLKIGGALVKFFTGDFKGAIEDTKAAVSGMGDEMAEEFRKAADARKSLQQVADTMRELGVERAKLNRDLVKAKEIIESETASYDEKKAAIEEVTKAETEQTEKELANAQKKLDAIRAQNALSDSSSEALQDEADAEAALYAIQQKSSEDRIKNIRLIKKAENEEKARIKELTAARKTAAAERAKLDEAEKKRIEDLAKLKLTEEEKALRALQDLNDKTEEEKLARKKERDLAEIEKLEQQGIDVRNLLIYNEELYNTLEDELRDKRAAEKAAKDEKEKADQIERDKKFAEEQAVIDKRALEQKKVLENSKKNLLDKTIGFLSSIAGKNKTLQKGIILAESALGIGRTIVSTQTANAAATAEGAALAIPTGGASVAAATGIVAANTASAGIGIAANIAATAKALQSIGGGAAATTGGSIKRGASAAPQVGFQASSENQIATSITGAQEETPPIEAFVAESQVTNAQQAARTRESDNSF